MPARPRRPSRPLPRDDEWSCHLLEEAIAAGDLEAVRAIIQTSPKQLNTLIGATSPSMPPLLLAASLVSGSKTSEPAELQARRFAIFQGLLAAPGLDMATADESGATVLHVAARYWKGNNPRLVQAADALVDQAAQAGLLNRPDSDGAAPLHAAATFHGSALLAPLLRAGADVNWGARPSAAKLQRLDELLGVLLAHPRVDVGYIDDEHGYDVWASALANLNEPHLRVLIGRKAMLPSLNHKDHTGNTVLHLAAALGKHWAIPLLLEAGADPSIKNEAGQVYTEVEEQPSDSEEQPSSSESEEEGGEEAGEEDAEPLSTSTRQQLATARCKAADAEEAGAEQEGAPGKRPRLADPQVGEQQQQQQQQAAASAPSQQEEAEGKQHEPALRAGQSPQKAPQPHVAAPGAPATPEQQVRQLLRRCAPLDAVSAANYRSLFGRHLSMEQREEELELLGIWAAASSWADMAAHVRRVVADEQRWEQLDAQG
ncbi:hypothetical protein ABPG75_004025 [Micractinium tetrahymenae]